MLFVQELDLKDFSMDLVSIPGYFTFVDGGSKKRVATIIKEGAFNRLTQIKQETRAQVWIEAETRRGEKITLANIYREWNNDQESVLEELCVWAESKRRGKAILAGDFNLDPTKFSLRTYNMRLTGNEFLSRMEGTGLERVSFGKTFERWIEGLKVESELDWLLTTDSSFIKNTSTLKTGLSDHALITWDVMLEERNGHERRLARGYGKVDWREFCIDLLQQPWESLAELDLEDMAQQINHLILEVLDQHAPLREVKVKGRRPVPRPSAVLKKLRRNRDNARSKGELKKLRHLRKECHARTRLETLQSVEERLKKSPQEAWKIVKELTGKSQRNTVKIKEDNRWLEAKESAERFNQHFLSKVEKIRGRIPNFCGDPIKGAKLRAEKLGLEKEAFSLRPVSEEVVLRALKRLKPSRCPDVYGIPPFLLKKTSEVLVVPITWAVNTSIIEGRVPTAWKKGRVLPLHKKGSRSTKENYRPVCILPSVSKVLEEAVRSQLSYYFEEKGILPESQYGFRSCRSTVLAAAAAELDWKRAKQRKLECGALFFDLSAAFDTLDKDLLVAKMKVYGVSRKSLEWVSSFLSAREQCVEVGGMKSETTTVRIGSPQGSVISPLLFSIMVADLEEWVTEGVVLSYADDTSCYAIAEETRRVREILEKSAREILLFMQASCLAANPTKTNFVYFGGKVQDPIRVGDSLVEEKKEETLLGITFNKRLNWSGHITKLKPELLKRTAVLRRLRAKLPKKTVCEMIDPIFTSKLRYALELVTDAAAESDSTLGQLHSLHRGAMKAALGIKPQEHPSDESLLALTGQLSVRQLSKIATSNLAWKCFKSRKSCPLLKGRLEDHTSLRQTRQRTLRAFPPQATRGTLLHRLVETWEKLPVQLRNKSAHEEVRGALKSFSLNN